MGKGTLQDVIEVEFGRALLAESQVDYQTGQQDKYLLSSSHNRIDTLILIISVYNS
jgi:hypothetical protein